MKKLLLSILILMVLFTGCDSSNKDNDNAQQSSKSRTDTINADDDSRNSTRSSLTVLDLKKKYGEDDEQPAIMPMYNVEHDKKFRFTFNFNMSDLFFYDSVVTVHTDRKALPESRVSTNNYLEDRDAEKSVLIVEPSYSVLTSQETGRDLETSWGYAPIYYLRVNYDLDATELVELEEPIIIPFTIKTELQAPGVRYEIDSDGRFKLVWDPVEGAEEYNVYHVYSSGNKEPIDGPEQGYNNAFPLLAGTVKSTEFQDFYADGIDGLYYEEILDEKVLTAQNFIVNGHYYVTAVKDGVESNFSPPVSTLELSGQLPVALEEREIYYELYETVQDLPKTAGVYYIDDSVRTHTVHYDQEHVEDKNGYVLIPFTIEGTALSGKVSVISYDPTALEQAAQENKDVRKSRREGLIQAENSTDYVPSPEVPTIIGDGNEQVDEDELIDAQREHTEKLVNEGNQETIPQSEIFEQIEIQADSAFEEYLAMHLIAASGEISLKAFPEAQSFDVISDTLLKVMYQNPYILDVKRYGYDYSSLTLFIEYSDSSDNIKKKQQEIVQEASKLVKSIVKNGMSDDEKRNAIYDYLNDHTVYDDAALENAEQNNFREVDSQFNDSFNTYGILVKKVGVCASYASVYKLLSDMAGLETIVVTGTLNHVPHAWNKVKVGNEWLHVDATNNETNSGIPYMLYYTNDETAQELQFFTNDQYWLNDELSQFAGRNNDRDYYVSNDLEMDSVEQFHHTLTESIQQGNDQLIVRFDDPIDEDAVLEQLIDVYSSAAPNQMEQAYYSIMTNYIVVSHASE